MTSDLQLDVNQGYTPGAKEAQTAAPEASSIVLHEPDAAVTVTAQMWVDLCTAVAGLQKAQAATVEVLKHLTAPPKQPK